MNDRPSRIEHFSPVHRGVIVATIHVFVCLLAASLAAVAPRDHYFSYLFIDFLQNESFLLGYFVALSSYSVVSRGILGICGVGLMMNLCRASTATNFPKLIAFAMFLLALAGVGWGAFLKILGARLRPEFCQSGDAPNAQFTLKHLMVVTAATCASLGFLREYIDGPVEMPEMMFFSALLMVHLAFPTVVVSSLAAVMLTAKTRTTLYASQCGTLFIAVAGAVLLTTNPLFAPGDKVFAWPMREIYLWLIETPIHMLLAMWLFRWMGLRLVSHS